MGQYLTIFGSMLGSIFGVVSLQFLDHVLGNLGDRFRVRMETKCAPLFEWLLGVPWSRFVSFLGCIGALFGGFVF